MVGRAPSGSVLGIAVTAVMHVVMTSAGAWAQPLSHATTPIEQEPQAPTYLESDASHEEALPSDTGTVAQRRIRARAMKEALKDVEQPGTSSPAVVLDAPDAPPAGTTAQPPAIPAPWPSPAGEPPADAMTTDGGQGEALDAASGQPADGEFKDPLAVTGGYRLSAGFTRDEVILRNAHGDYNERNFRILTGNLHENTFDPGIYSRLWFDADTTCEEGWNLHAKVVIDPWSFIGTTDRVVVHSGTGAGDEALIQLKYWGATNRMINETFFTNALGDSFATPEIEVDDGHTVRTRVTSLFGLQYDIPELDIDYKFHPLREFWLDYTTDITHLRVFPAAYEDQALTSDDPLQLSNHHIYWEPSPWMDEWRPGNFNARTGTATVPDDFTRGEWEDDLVFFTRDSDLQRLSVLRGATLQWQPSDLLSYQGAIASPKTLWEDYEQFNRFVGMSRLKYQLADWAEVGGTYTTRWAYDRGRQLDATNHVYSIDGTLTPADALQFDAQMATSYSSQDRTSDYASNLHGNAWHMALTVGGGAGGADVGEEAKEEGAAPARLRFRTYWTHMDEAFDPGLANYRETRDDMFWGRHLSFYRPLSAYRAEMKPLTLGSSTRLDEIMPFRIGDGVDTGRNAFGARFTTKLFDERLDSLYDIRNVHDTDGEYIETVLRTEQQWRITPRLTSRFIYLYHDRPNHQGVDPYVANADLNIFSANNPVGDRDPSAMLFSTGLDYVFTDYLAGWVIYERTSDIVGLGSDNYPRGLFNGSSFGTTREGDQVIRREVVFLNRGGVFPLPEYPWFDIYRAGVHWRAGDMLEGAVTWTRNEYSFSGQIDENMNHVGFEMAFHPTDKMSVLGKYTLSNSVDLPKLNDTGLVDVARHNNLFVEGRYQVTDASEFIAQFGVGSIVPPATVFTVSPQGQYFPALDTQMIVRISYTGKF